MRNCLKRVGWIAIVLPVAGCAWLPDAYSGCDEAQPYQSSRQAEPLRVPAGGAQPDTRSALRIPEVTSPELPPEPGRCLDHPPAYSTNSQATASAAPPAAAGGELDFGMDGDRQWETRLGVNYSTLKQWIYKGTVRTTRTDGGHHRVPVHIHDSTYVNQSRS